MKFGTHEDIPCPHLLLKFHPKIFKFSITGTYPKFLYDQKTHVGPLGVQWQCKRVTLLTFGVKEGKENFFNQINCPS